MTRHPRASLLLSLLVASTVAAGSYGCGSGENRRFGSLGTAGTGGIYYPLGGALARMVSERLPGYRLSAEVTGGSVENINRVASGEMDLGMAIGTSLVRARESDPATARLRIVAPLYPNVAHVLVRSGSAAAEVSDFAGGRVSLGAAGSGTEQMARDILSAYGLAVDDVDARYLSFQESSSALRDGAIDAAIFSVGVPASSVLEATTAGGARLLSVAGPALERLIAEHAHYAAGTIPAQSYPGLQADLRTAAVLNWIFADAELDAAVATALLDILEERAGELADVNDVARQIDLTALDRAPLPLHDATVAWRAAR